MFKQLHCKGIGTETKVTPALSQTEEDKLWETGVINLDSPTGLLRAVFFTMVRISALHSKNRWVEIFMKGYFNLKMHVLK